MGSKNYIHKLASFREIMLERLRANRWKGGWKGASFHYLQGRLLEEVIEVAEAARYRKTNKAWIARECADVANIAMMIADITGGLNNERTTTNKGERSK